MGRPKLLLPWRGKTILHRVLEAWASSAVEHTVVVVHPDDVALAQVARAAEALVVVPNGAPVDMKASVRIALEFIRRRFGPRDSDTWLLAPADMPNLDPATIDAVLSRRQRVDADAVVPIHGGRRGHPVAFSWRLAEEVDRLDEHAGINTLLKQCVVHGEEVNDAGILEDIDTPGDYENLD